MNETYFSFLDDVRLSSSEQLYEDNLREILSIEFALSAKEAKNIVNEYYRSIKNRTQILHG